jgi:hypothetical protein
VPRATSFLHLFLPLARLYGSHPPRADAVAMPSAGAVAIAAAMVDGDLVRVLA